MELPLMFVSSAIGFPVDVMIILPDFESLFQTLPGLTRKSRTATESMIPPVGQMSYTEIYHNSGKLQQHFRHPAKE
jgi:hypothetical protein